MPAENLPIQNINNSTLGFAFGSGNLCNPSYMTFIMGADCSTQAAGAYAYAEGYGTTAAAPCVHAEGNLTVAAGGDGAHAEGSHTTASAPSTHAEGGGTRAVGHYSHAEGQNTYAVGSQSHAEGYATSAVGIDSHAEGECTRAVGDYSHAEGYYTIADDAAMHVDGKFNQTSSNAAFVIGNGTNATARSDAFIVDWNGKVSATSFENSAGEIPALIPTASQPAGSVACTIYSGTDGKYYIVS